MRSKQPGDCAEAQFRALAERTRPRDLYDVVNLYRNGEARPEPQRFREVLRAKCEFKGIGIPSIADLEPHCPDLEAGWIHMLEHQLPALLPLSTFWDALPEIFAWLNGAVPQPLAALVESLSGHVPPPQAPAAGLSLTAVQVTAPGHGTLSLAGNGSFVYTPTAGYTGSDSFTYDATDGTRRSNTATVNLSITNQAPVAVNDSYSVLHDQVLSASATSGVLANDTDGNNDTLTASLLSGRGPNHGTLDLNSDCTFTYTPTGYCCGTDRLQYLAYSDSTSSAAATVCINGTCNQYVANPFSYAVPLD